ncbi:uncharacterized protein EI90DRAFT_2907896 [Cantharellus anzutake]|uniref:uncharacterized protein n=1 Tax=Cantharellus anzutake TaxID=1750568 RepID=UPI0019081C7F|nr:uncharacterized protein EI90DRAFT_2907896 [Cantharellus anzutake]KAF8340021.1 hypothetical protein EI90DRAFT_2907896 [Cantharellus anzutake]
MLTLRHLPLVPNPRPSSSKRTKHPTPTPLPTPLRSHPPYDLVISPSGFLNLISPSPTLIPLHTCIVALIIYLITSVQSSPAKEYSPFGRSTRITPLPPLDDSEPDFHSSPSRALKQNPTVFQSFSSALNDFPSFSSTSVGGTRQEDSTEDRYTVIHDILRCTDLYAVLDVDKSVDANGLRRGYMKRCKACHPDKFPSYPLATVAFQKVSFAYETLSTPSSRRLYDAHVAADNTFNFFHHQSGGTGGFASYKAADETLTGVLVGVFCDFMEGDFGMLRTFLRAMNELNPALNISDDTIESVIRSFARLREILLTGQKYVQIVRFELIRLYEIQHSLRQLSYFDVCGRLRLTLQLARVTLSLPCRIDRAMIEEAEEEERRMAAAAGMNAHHANGNCFGRTDGECEECSGKAGGSRRGRPRRRGLLHPSVNSVLVSVCGVLEYGERAL